MKATPSMIVAASAGFEGCTAQAGGGPSGDAFAGASVFLRAPVISASFARLWAPGVSLRPASTACDARPTCRISSSITAIPRCTLSSRDALTIPTRPSGSAWCAFCSTCEASPAMARTSGWVSARTVWRIRTIASPSWRTSSGENPSTTRSPTRIISRPKVK